MRHQSDKLETRLRHEEHHLAINQEWCDGLYPHDYVILLGTKIVHVGQCEQTALNIFNYYMQMEGEYDEFPVFCPPLNKVNENFPMCEA